MAESDVSKLVRFMQESFSPRGLDAVRKELNQGIRRDCPTLRKVCGDGEIELIPNENDNSYNITCPYFDKYYGASSACGILGNKRAGCPYMYVSKP